MGVLICLALSCPAGALNLEFVADSQEHQAAVAEYQEVWRETCIEGQPIYLRASYPIPTKRATLVHELAHRYLAELDSDSENSVILSS